MFLVLVSNLVMLLYIDDGYHFLRSWGGLFLLWFYFVGFCHFCFFQDVLVGLDIYFWLLGSFGPKNVLYASILTTKTNRW